MFFSNEKECILCQRQNYKMFFLQFWWPFWWSMPWSAIIFHWISVAWRIRYSWWHLAKMKIMWPAAIILEFFVVEKLSTMLAFRIVSPQDKPIFITLAISSMIVCLMCRWWVLLQHYFLRTQAATLLRYGSRQQWWISRWHFAGRFLVPVLLADWFSEQ